MAPGNEIESGLRTRLSPRIPKQSDVDGRHYG